MLKDCFKIAFGVTLGIETAKVTIAAFAKLAQAATVKIEKAGSSESPENWRGSKSRAAKE